MIFLAFHCPPHMDLSVNITVRNPWVPDPVVQNLNWSRGTMGSCVPKSLVSGRNEWLHSYGYAIDFNFSCLTCIKEENSSKLNRPHNLHILFRRNVCDHCMADIKRAPKNIRITNYWYNSGDNMNWQVYISSSVIKVFHGIPIRIVIEFNSGDSQKTINILIEISPNFILKGG
jgi:hypothetical protein